MDNIIIVKSLCKSYKVSKRNSGIKNALKSFIKKEYDIVKAVDDITFDIKEGEIVDFTLIETAKGCQAVNVREVNPAVI